MEPFGAFFGTKCTPYLEAPLKARSGVKGLRLALCKKLPPKNLKNMYLQSQSRLLGHFSVLLLLQCWCTKFGELTGINNIRRTRRQPEAQKTIFVWDCRLVSFFIKILPTSYLASSLRREGVMMTRLPTTHPSHPPSNNSWFMQSTETLNTILWLDVFRLELWRPWMLECPS